jgi:Hydroxymethylglutaryl-coenzyme A reductase
MTASAAAPLPLAGPAAPPPRREIPRQANDYTTEAAKRRLAFLAETTDAAPEHLGRYSFDPTVLDGNIENFIGVAQVPIGIAGPLTSRPPRRAPTAGTGARPRRRRQAPAGA